jgi:hypothetical protein
MMGLLSALACLTFWYTVIGQRDRGRAALPGIGAAQALVGSAAIGCVDGLWSMKLGACLVLPWPPGRTCMRFLWAG